MADNSKLQFYSGNVIDKIASYSSKIDSSSASIATNISYPIGASLGGGTFLKESIANPYGVAGFVTLSFSVDGVNYYEQTDQPNLNIQASCYASCTSSTIYFHMQNQSVSAQTIYIQYAMDTLT